MLAGLELSTEQLLTAVKSPSRVRDMSTNRWRRIDYRNLGAEELGAIYESWNSPPTAMARVRETLCLRLPAFFGQVRVAWLGGGTRPAS